MVDQFDRIEFTGGMEFPELTGPRCATEHRRLLEIIPVYRRHCQGTDEEGHTIVEPRAEDRKAIRILLKGWLREISDRYLSRTSIDEFSSSNPARIRHGEGDRCYEFIARNAPRGAVKFLYNDLSNNSMLFGDSLPSTLTYNNYFSRLLLWDDANCFGLNMEISQKLNITNMGGNSAINVYYQSAQKFISRAQETHNTIYYEMVN